MPNRCSFYWVAGRMARLMDEGMERNAARRQAKAEWRAIPAHIRAIWRTPFLARPAFQVIDERSSAN